jgi:hypothetical protein
MFVSSLMLHTGGQLCSYDELRAIPAPPAEGRWHPVGHSAVLDAVVTTLNGAGYLIKDRKLAIAREGKRFFGTLDLTTPLVPGVALAVGVRNSIDKSFPLGFCAGSRVFVCDNLAFRSELLVRRKHTRFGEVRFQNAIADAVQSLASFRAAEEDRIERMMAMHLTDDQALALIVRGMEKAIIAAPLIPKVLAEWRRPQHDYGTGDLPTAWRLLNCFTTVLGPRAIRNPNEYAGQTIRLNALLGPREPVPAFDAALTHLAIASPPEANHGQAA